jgi:hypothetical protein
VRVPEREHAAHRRRGEHHDKESAPRVSELEVGGSHVRRMRLKRGDALVPRPRDPPLAFGDSY